MIACTLPVQSPVREYIPATRTEPARFPSQQVTHTVTESWNVTFFWNIPTAITKLLPVKSSAPAIKTRLRATPKQPPIINFTPGTPPSFNIPPAVNARRTPNPTNIPASIAEMKYAPVCCRRNWIFFLAAFPAMSISSRNILISSSVSHHSSILEHPAFCHILQDTNQNIISVLWVRIKYFLSYKSDFR